MLLKRFPVEYQMDSQDCGPASLKIIAKYFGKYYSLQYLRDRCGITKEGASLLDLSTGAESIGLRTLPIIISSTTSLFQLLFSGKRVILWWFITRTKGIFGFPTQPKGISNTAMKNSGKDGIKKEKCRVLY